MVAARDSLRRGHRERRPQLSVQQAQQRADVGGVVRREEAPAGALHTTKGDDEDLTNCTEYSNPRNKELLQQTCTRPCANAVLTAAKLA
jgi:hypothetical protein